MKICILHLSDIHLGQSGNPILGYSDSIAAAIQEILPVSSHVFIVISGDIANTGQKLEYDHAEVLVAELKSAIAKRATVIVELVIAPGNHDCNLRKNNKAREGVIRTVLVDGQQAVDDRVVDTCTEIQSEFFDLRDRVAPPTLISGHLTVRYEYDVGPYRIAFNALNDSWCFLSTTQVGTLFMPSDEMKALENKGDDLTITVMHHPVAWFVQGNHLEVRSFLEATSDIVFTGHEHHASARAVDSSFDGSSNLVEGGILQKSASQLGDSSFNVVEVDLNKRQFRVRLLERQGGVYATKTLRTDWTSYRDLPVKRSKFPIQKAFATHLNDIGAAFRHPTRGEIHLDDVYIFPDLRDVAENPTTISRFPADALISKERLDQRVWIRGEDKFGKTKLSHKYFQRFHQTGYVPIHLSGRAFARSSAREVDSLIRAAAREQYGSDKVESVVQVSTDRLVIIIDDLDCAAISESDLGGLLTYISRRAKKVFVFTADLMHLRELSSTDLSEALRSYAKYSIMSFGPKRRLELVTKWLTLDPRESLPTKELEHKTDAAEKLLETVLNKSLVPQVPLYMLTILQSMNGNGQNDLAHSGYGHYYHFLIVFALRRAKVRPEQLDETLSYCTHLARFANLRGRSGLSEAEMREFNAWFCAEYTHVNLEDRLRVLIESSILWRSGGEYSFRYRYIGHFFYGRWIAENLESSAEVQTLVTNLVSSLQDREAGHIVLFVIHHTKGVRVRNQVLAVLNARFAGVKALEFDSDIKKINEVITSTSNLVYEEENPKDGRKRIRHVEEEALERDEVSFQGGGYVAEATALFRAVDLIGQVLKSYYGSIRNAEKVDLMEAAIDGPLRALGALFEGINRDPEAVLSDIEGAIESRHAKKMDKESYRALARTEAFNFLLLMSAIFVGKTARAVSAPELLTISRDVVDRKPSTARKLLDLLIRLESSSELPVEAIEALAKEIKAKPLVLRILQAMVIRHLYMFTSDFDRKQRVCACLSIGIERQKSIELQVATARMLSGQPRSKEGRRKRLT